MNNIIKNMLIMLFFLSIAWAMVIGRFIGTKGNLKRCLPLAGVALFATIIGGFALVPYFADLMDKETISFEGVYVYSNPCPDLNNEEYFDTNGDGKSDDYFVRSIFNGSKYVPKKGKRYRVVVYKHSHTIYSLELLE